MGSRIVSNPPWEPIAPGRLYHLLTGQRTAAARRVAVAQTQVAISPGSSAAFRGAQVGAWRHGIDPSAKDSCKFVAGDLLVEMWCARVLGC